MTIESRSYWELGPAHRWEPILRPLCERLERAGYVVVQVKAKFGAPCVYLADHAEFGLTGELAEAYRKALGRCT